MENNRQLFMVWGFNETADSQASKVKVEHDINAIHSGYPQRCLKLRGKTATPEKVATYIAQYINKVTADFAPYYSHSFHGR